MADDTWIRVVTIVALAVVLTTAVIGITVVAVFTTRDLWRAEVLTFAGVVLLGALGGVSWWALRRHPHRWRVQVARNGADDDETPASP